MKIFTPGHNTVQFKFWRPAKWIGKVFLSRASIHTTKVRISDNRGHVFPSNNHLIMFFGGISTLNIKYFSVKMQFIFNTYGKIENVLHSFCPLILSSPAHIYVWIFLYKILAPFAIMILATSKSLTGLALFFNKKV